MFDDNGGSGAAPLDNLTEDDIVLLDGDYDEVGELVHEWNSTEILHVSLEYGATVKKIEYISLLLWERPSLHVSL